MPTRHFVVLWVVLVGFLCAQIGYARVLVPLRPAIEEIPFPLGELGVKGIALGDEQFLFRFLARWLQEVGDGGGRVRPLKDYDYDRVVGWLKVLDRLDDQSNYSYWLAARYFGAVLEPNFGPERVRKIVLYFRERAVADPARHWPGLVWAAARVRRVVKDRDLSGLIARDLVALRGDPRVPSWLPLLVPPLYRFAGEIEEAKALETDPEFAALRRGVLRDFLEKLNLQDGP